jgi:NADH-quinone oxidoreductase subunit J
MTPFPVSGLILSAIFVLCLLLLALGACIAVVSSRLIRSVCGLAICSVGLAGLYYFLHSPFLALMEILIYIGAVCVTIVFAVMLAETEEPARTETSGATLAWGGLACLIVAAIFGGLLWLGFGSDWSAPAALLNDGSIAAIGRALLTTYSMAFELISLALLVAIVGALAIARAGRTRPETIPAKAISGLESRDEAARRPKPVAFAHPIAPPPKGGTPNLVTS